MNYIEVNIFDYRSRNPRPRNATKIMEKRSSVLHFSSHITARTIRANIKKCVQLTVSKTTKFTMRNDENALFRLKQAKVTNLRHIVIPHFLRNLSILDNTSY